jgi:hypothetical protein
MKEEGVRPYGLYVVGQVRGRKGALPRRNNLGTAAIAADEELQGPRALGPAWRTPGESSHAAGQAEDTQRFGQRAAHLPPTRRRTKIGSIETLSASWRERLLFSAA